MRIYSRTRRLLPLIAAAMAVLACAATPPTNFYVLAPIPAPVDTSVKTGTKRLIGLGPVTLPALLERKQLVTRTGNNTIQIAEQHQWAAPLKENMTQTLTENLAKLKANDLVKAYPWSAYGEADYRILVDVIRFDTTPGQSVDLEANWAIMAEKNHVILSNGLAKISRQLADTSFTGAVQGLSSVLAEFSRQLAIAMDDIK